MPGSGRKQFCKELPPGIVHLGEEWVQSKPIRFDGLTDQCYIKGRFDCVLKFDDGTFGIIDFKTAKATEEKTEMYSRQLQAYTHALENAVSGSHSLIPIKKLGLLFFEPVGFEQDSLMSQSFRGRLKWVEVHRNDEKFIVFLREVMTLLSQANPPQSASDCNWCNYRSKMSTLNLSAPAPAAAESSRCPKCNGPMKLRVGKYGKFWSCEQYPDCKGTKTPK